MGRVASYFFQMLFRNMRTCEDEDDDEDEGDDENINGEESRKLNIKNITFKH